MCNECGFGSPAAVGERCGDKQRRPALRMLLSMALGALLLVGAAVAAEVEVTGAGLTSSEDGYLLNADFRTELSARLEDVVSRGVPLYFVIDFELRRPRWYWFDQLVENRERSFRLSYHALTRQYRLSSGVLYQNFATLEDALAILSRIRDWPVAERGALKQGVTYQAQLRLRLDLTQLPKPLQVTAIGSKEWSLDSDWYRFGYTPGEREAK